MCFVKFNSTDFWTISYVFVKFNSIDFGSSSYVFHDICFFVKLNTSSYVFVKFNCIHKCW